MFRILFPRLSVIIEGCPEKGIPAIDFRRSRGIPEAPTNRIAIPLDMTSESLVRKYERFTDAEGDLKSNRGENAQHYDSYDNGKDDVAGLVGSSSRGGYLVRHVVSPMAVLGGLSGTEEGIDALLAELASDKAGQKIKAEKAAEEAEREAKAQAAIAELLADKQQAIEDCIVLAKSHKPGERWSINLNHPHRSLLAGGDRHDDGFPRKTRFDALQPIIDAVGAEITSRNAADVAAREAAKAAELAAMADWIDQHGSTRLKRSLAEGIECATAYADERLATERPGWAWYDEVDGEVDDPRNPPESAFEVLDEARKTDSSAKLQFYVDKSGALRISGYVAYADFLDRGIVFGVDRITDDECDEADDE